MTTCMKKGGKAMKKGKCFAAGGAGKINHEEMTPQGKPLPLKKGGKVK